MTSAEAARPTLPNIALNALYAPMLFMSRYCSMMTYITYRPTYNKGNPGKTGRFKIHVLYSQRSSRFIFALQHYKYRYRKSEKIFLSVMEKKKRRMGVDTYGRSTKVEKVEESQLR